MISINSQFVDEKYVSIIEPNLYLDSVLLPNVTFTEKYKVGQAGGIYIHKLGAKGLKAPGVPGTDFTDSTTADSLIQAVFNNNFQHSEKIYGVTAVSVAYNKAEEEFADVLATLREGWNVSGVAALVNEGTDLSDVTAITESNVLDYIISMRKGLKDAKANPTYVMCSTAVYESLLKQAGTDFVPVKNDNVVESGRAGIYYGMRVIEANALGETVAKYYDYTSTLQTLDLTTVDMVMGDAQAFSALNNFEMMRIIDSELFSGVKVQAEFNAAYRVTNSDRISVKFNA